MIGLRRTEPQSLYLFIYFKQAKEEISPVLGGCDEGANTSNFAPSHWSEIELHQMSPGDLVMMEGVEWNVHFFFTQTIVCFSFL